ncbi:hypothetical protein Hypma_002603 [Hypsizygus marmoreus]|uniref:Uncharacterized protein n=1 Tax=Hypsizygus marmoreus TaxID=39966 RepID=A0A369JBF8_HYPMA|nr:hypothetical protein Hypma_002603 [Hypsizygus marmoreus]
MRLGLMDMTLASCHKSISRSMPEHVLRSYYSSLTLQHSLCQISLRLWLPCRSQEFQNAHSRHAKNTVRFSRFGSSTLDVTLEQSYGDEFKSTKEPSVVSDRTLLRFTTFENKRIRI